MSTRTIIDCPPAPKVSSDEYHPDAISKTYPISVITPIFGGGAKAGFSDELKPIRPSSIRGHLRFWWRATRGTACQDAAELYKREAEIWGSTENPSPVKITVKLLDTPAKLILGEKDNHNNPIRPFGFDRYGSEVYAIFPAINLAKDNDVFYLLKEGFKFSLTVEWVKLVNGNDIAPDIEAALWAWLNFGGIGARTRRGLGALYCEDFAPPSYAKFSDWLKKNFTTYQLKTTAKEWPTAFSSVWLKNGNKALECWTTAIVAMKEFRQGIIYGRDGTDPKHPKRSRWPEAEAVRELVASQHALTSRPAGWHPKDGRMPVSSFPRAEFGMPIIFEIKGESIPKAKKDKNGNPIPIKPTLQPDKESERMASPIILRPIQFADKTSASMIAHLNVSPLDCAYLKPGEADLTSGAKIIKTQITNPIFATYEKDSPMSGRSENGSAVEAFLGFAEKVKSFVRQFK